MLDDQQFAEIAALLSIKDRSAVRGEFERATDGTTDRTLINSCLLSAWRELLDEEGNAFTRTLCKCLDELKTMYYDGIVADYLQDKQEFDFLRFTFLLKKYIDEIVGTYASGMSYGDQQSLLNILSISVNLAIDYSSLERFALSYESKLEQIRNARYLFGKRVVCEICRKSRRISNVTVCKGCGLMFCRNCASSVDPRVKCPQCRWGNDYNALTWAQKFQS